MVKLYTIGCPACIVLEKKLLAKKIAFEKVEDQEVLNTLGITTFPMLEVDDNGVLMDLGTANTWVNSYPGK